VAAYLTLATFKDLTVMPDAVVDAIEVASPGFIDKQLGIWSRWIDARLTKRYASPFVDPAPDTVKLWLQAIVTFRAFLKRGVDPNDEQMAEIKKDLDQAVAEIKEAATAETGLFELPLTEGGAGAVSKGGPLGYSEQSPYVWMDRQAETGRDEDLAGTGTST